MLRPLAAVAGALALGLACTREVPTAPFVTLAIEPDTTTLVAGAVVQPITGAPRVRVRRDGSVAAGVPVRFTVMEGGGAVERRVDTTDAQGWASAGTWTSGTRAGLQRLVAFVPDGGVDARVEFSVTAAPGVAVTAAITPAYVVVERGQTTALTGTLRDAHGNVVPPTGTVSWTSTRPSVATFASPSSSTVIAAAAGWAPVVFAANGLADTSFVAVPSSMPAFTRDTVTPALRGNVVAVGGGRGYVNAGALGPARFTLAPFEGSGSVNTGGGILDIAFTPGTDTAWTVDGGRDRLFKIDASTNTLLDSIALPATPLRLEPSPDGQYLYVLTSDGVLLRVDVQTRAVTSRALSGGMMSLAVSPSGDALYVGTGAGGLARVTTAPFAVVQVVQVGGEVRDVALSADGQRVYVASSTGLRMRLAADLSSLTAVTAISDAFALHIAPGDSTILVSRDVSSRVAFLDAGSLSVLGELPLVLPGRMTRVPGTKDVLVTSQFQSLSRLRF